LIQGKSDGNNLQGALPFPIYAFAQMRAHK
jgi:hypothetical protein